MKKENDSISGKLATSGTHPEKIDPASINLSPKEQMLNAVASAAKRKARSAETAEDMEALAAISLACRNLGVDDLYLFSLTREAVTRFAEKAETIDDMNAILHLSSHYPQW